MMKNTRHAPLVSCAWQRHHPLVAGVGVDVCAWKVRLRYATAQRTVCVVACARRGIGFWTTVKKFFLTSPVKKQKKVGLAERAPGGARGVPDIRQPEKWL